MSTYVLVHGSWMGAWCWQWMGSSLKQAGHTVIAPDLPAHGADTTPPEQATLESYTDCITEILDAQAEPVILVGHGMGGAVISQAAEARPDKVQTLFYLAGFLLQNGQSVLQWVQQDSESLLAPNLAPEPAADLVTIKTEVISQAFFNDCSPQEMAWAAGQVLPEPLVPLQTPVQLSEGRYGRLPRVYITTLEDHAISPDLQRRMYTALPCYVVPLQTGHAPFVCVPAELSEEILAIPQPAPTQA